jgi:hypothetical protein
VAWLDHGTLRRIGPAPDVIAEYQEASLGAGTELGA